MLTTTDHRRDVAGMTYVYPVISRRSGGLSIGINLNPNNACNWRCIYCQVPDLVRGSAPEINLELLESELRQLLDQIRDGRFNRRFETDIAPGSVRDFALSGNGEPTTAREFDQVIERVGMVRADYGIQDSAGLVLISNGSLVHQKTVQAGLEELSKLQGEVWFKLDSVTDAGIRRINNAAIGIDRVRQNLRQCAALCHTWIQSCFFRYRGRNPEREEIDAYLAFMDDVVRSGAGIRGVQLYGIERDPMQPEAGDLDKVESAWLESLAGQLRAMELEVVVKN